MPIRYLAAEWTHSVLSIDDLWNAVMFEVSECARCDLRLLIMGALRVSLQQLLQCDETDIIKPNTLTRAERANYCKTYQRKPKKCTNRS